MTQIERESLVERYLSGAMTPAEESEFFLHTAVDDELQRTLKAFRIMDKAIQNDRETAVAERSRYREQVFGMLAASHAATGTGVSGAGSASAGSVPAGSAPAGAGGLGFWKTLLISVVTGGLAVGTALVILPSLSGGNDQVPATREAAPAAAPRQMEQIPATVESSVEPSPEASGGSAGAVSVPSDMRRSAGTSRSGEGENATSAPKSRSRASGAATSETTAPAGRADDDGYLQLGDSGENEIKIRTEVETPSGTAP